VAQKILVGQLDDAWRTMLASYDRSSEASSFCSLCSACRVDARVWEKTGDFSICPEDQKYTLPFPEALAGFLVKNSYLTPEQSKSLGYNVVQNELSRKKDIEAATVAYETQREQEWFGYSRYGECMKPNVPRSPAALITMDRMNGLEDNVRVLKSDTAGKTLVVRVGEPHGNGMGNRVHVLQGPVGMRSVSQ
jgi:hypothetical protein